MSLSQVVIIIRTSHLSDKMIRRKARERREYLYRKAVEDRHRAIQDKKDRVKSALASNKLLDTDVKRDALELAR